MAFVAHTALPLRRARTATTSVRRPRMSKPTPSQSLPTILLDRNAKNRLQRVAALFSQELNRTASLAAAAAVLAAVASNAAPVHAAADPVQMTGVRQETSAATSRSMSSESSPAPVSNGVQDWRYSQFINAVEKDQVEKVTFSADGQRLLAVDTDGNRFV